MYTLSLTLLTFFTLTLTGCGGGSDEAASTPKSSTTASSNPTTSTTPTSDSTTPTSSTDTSSDPIPALKDGIKVTDSSVVEGLTVICGDTELTTNINGEFVCNTLPFSLYLGEYKLGEISKLPSDKVIYTQNLMHVVRGAIAYPEVTKLSMILQTLDEDANPLNGITLKQDSIEILNAQLSQQSKLADYSLEDISTILQNVVDTRKDENQNSKLQLFSAQKAQENLADMTAQTPAQTYAQRSMGRIQ